VLFVNYQHRLRPAGGASKFDLERAYLTVRGPLGERTRFRVTTDVFQQERDTVNRSWQLRAKYAYLEHDYLRRADWNAWARLGILQTVFIDHDELFWPRWLGSVPTDRHGFFSSADVGISTRVGLPARRGEIYATITNGPGFASRETDRFKDYALRLTLTPLAGQAQNAWRTLALSAWGYKGALASRFVSGGAGQAGPVSESLRRDRWGVHAAVSLPRITAAVQHARRIDEGETGANTPADPRVVIDSTGSITGAYAIIRPFTAGAGSRAFVISRWERVNVHRVIGRPHDHVIAGVGWTLAPRASLALDFQATYPRAGSTVAPARTVFLHAQGSF